ncbi:hypothetical protein RSOL_388210, partial [Rhizoctonia solani AG-3 Rhs1AP]
MEGSQQLVHSTKPIGIRLKLNGVAHQRRLIFIGHSAPCQPCLVIGYLALDAAKQIFEPKQRDLHAIGVVGYSIVNGGYGTEKRFFDWGWSPDGAIRASISVIGNKDPQPHGVGSGVTDPAHHTATETPVTHIASRSHHEIEIITPYLVHPSETGLPFPDNFKVDLSEGKNRDMVIAEHISYIETNCYADRPALIGYSDGHAKTYSGCPKVAYGYVVYTKKLPIILKAASIGPRASIYDAEMLGLAKCLTKAVRYASANPNYTHIKLYCDNKSAVQTIHDLRRHPAQFASLIFRQAFDLFLDGHPERRVTIACILR